MWVDNIKMNLMQGERELGFVDWIDLAQDMDRWSSLENTVMNL
jgi:hypothetical protein